MNPFSSRLLLVVVVLVLTATACSSTTGIRTAAAPAGSLRQYDARPPAAPSLLDLRDPQIKNLDPDLRRAVERAARAAQADGIRVSITSGWRSRQHQQRLFDKAVEEYGSAAEASRHVSTPDRSAHVRGDAVDIGNGDADSWMSRHGYQYGLCQSFANERWHFELTVVPGRPCPAPVPDSSYR